MPRDLVKRYGRGTLARLIAAFYQDVLDSPILSPYFDGVAMSRLIDHQTAFLAMVMGGPQSHTRDKIAESHRSLGISESDFEEMIRILERHLRLFEIDEEHAATIIAEYRSYVDEVVFAR